MNRKKVKIDKKKLKILSLWAHVQLLNYMVILI